MLAVVLMLLTACARQESDDSAARDETAVPGETAAPPAGDSDFLDRFVSVPSPRLKTLSEELARDLSMFSFAFPEVRESWQKSMEGGHRDFPIGDFTLPYIEDSTVVLTQDSLAGRPYLLTRIYADTDEQQFAYYRLLHEKYGAHGLRFVFLFQRDERFTATWEEMKASGFGFPGFVARLEDARFEKQRLFKPSEVPGFNEFLVNGEGMVIASGPQTRPLEFLYWTLEHRFGE